MIEELGIDSIRLITNNPNKIQGLSSLGVEVSGRIPLQMEPNRFNSFYLDTKRRKSGHLL
jgi:3,4-dihydroxy 2-butanone 4-phosphate synthase/GTP cyclohydrolase II